VNRQFIRFLFVGGINTCFSYGVYSLLIYLGLPYVLANLGAVTLGILFSFETQGRLVFGNRDRALIFRFAGYWMGIFVVNTSLIAVLVNAGLNEYQAGALAMIPTALLSFFIQKLLVFGRRSNRH
jgi:putative flippase GtrA